MLSLPPEIGRGELRDVNLLFALLAVQLIVATYLTSGFASAELALEGEKGLPDLVLSAFSPRAIAAGKVQSSALYACYLIVMAVPLAVLAAALRGAPLGAIAWAALVTVAVATAAGTWGAWMGGRFASDFTRSFLHWVMLGAVFAGTAMLPAPWSVTNPLRLIEGAVRDGWSGTMSAVTAVYLGAAVAGAVLIASHVRAARGADEE
ncbi:MAG: hypothetical protein ACT4PY_15395 [Armatimonadota bacterium]